GTLDRRSKRYRSSVGRRLRGARCPARALELTDPPAEQADRDEADDERSVQDGQCARVASRRVEDRRGELWTGDAGEPPRRERVAVDRADLRGAEEIAEVCRQTGKAAAVTGDDQEDQSREQPDARDLWHHEEGDDLDDEKRRVGRRPTDVVRQSGPDDSAAAVEDADVAGDER